MSIESLKAQARRHEQQDEWQKALDQYGKAIEKLAEDDQPDINLYNRVGDLYVRVGNYEQALEHYERAIELYREAYLPNNAIAVCKKIVRHMPARHQVYLMMGQIRAEQGFVPDARTNFLTYAEIMQEEGDLDESFRALVEFCDLVTGEVEVRITVAEQMIANERPEDGLAQLSIAYRLLKEQGRDDRAFGLEGKLLELDPSFDFDALLEEDPAGGEAEDDIFELATDEDDGPGETPIVEGAADLQDADALADEDAFLGEDDVSVSDGIPDDEGEDGEDEAPPLPMMDMEEPEDAADDLAEDPAEDLADDGWDAALVRPDEDDEPDLEPLEDIAAGAEEAGGEDEEVDLPLMDPDGGADEGVGYEEHEEDDILLDPDAAEEPDSGPEAPAPEPPAEPAALSDEYVDLGSMIFGDQSNEPKDTRFRVQYQEPSGDENADFQQMLSQFKDKVSENLDASDVTAHYDLGTAYKEMGLLDEAIAEFQAALRASGEHLPTYEMMGQTFLEMGKNEAAVKSLERALSARTTIEDELVGIYYYLARAYEQLGRKDSAVEFYDRVFSLDINFADVTERLRALR